MNGLPLPKRRGTGLRLTVALFLALALLISLAATPAVAAEKPSDHQYKPRDHDDDDNNNRNNNNRNNNNNNNNNNRNNGGGGGGFLITQESEQEAESGDVDQSFTVTSEGDNSNQCAGLQGEGQTGNAQNQTDLLQANSTADDFEFDEVGSTIDSSPSNSTSCDQQVNQAAAASDTSDAGYWTSWASYNPVYGWVYQWSDGSLWYYDYTLGDYAPYPYTTVSDTATGVLNTAGGLTTLAVLGTLGLAGTGLMIRRSRHS